MSYHFMIFGFSVAAALYYYFNRHRSLTCDVQSSYVSKNWDYEAKYKERDHKCTICLEVMEPNSHITLSPCKHIFHKVCWVAMLQRNVEATCPNCRQSIL